MSKNDIDSSISLGAVPIGESSLAITSPDYDEARQIQMCLAYRDQILRHYGDPPAGASIFVRLSRIFNRLAGEVIISYDGDDDEAYSYALSVITDNRGALYVWDDEATAQIGTPPQLVEPPIWRAAFFFKRSIENVAIIGYM